MYWAAHFLGFAVSEAVVGIFARWDLRLAMFSSWQLLRLRSTGMRRRRVSAAFRPAPLISSGLKPFPGRWLPSALMTKGFMWCILLVNSCVTVATAWAHTFDAFAFMVEASNVFACAS